MVADIGSYLHPWHLIPLAIFLVGWLLGGGWLFWRGLRKHSALSARRLKFRRGLLATLTTGAAAMIVGGLVAVLFHRLGQNLGNPDWTFVGIAMGAILGMTAAYTIAYVMLGLSARLTFKAAWPPILGMFLLAGVLAAICVPVIRSQANDKLLQDRCKENIESIRYSLAFYCTRTGAMPKNLQVLVDGKHLPDDKIRCPATKNKKEYFYLPRVQKKGAGQTIVLCDLVGDHPGGRWVILAPPSGSENKLNEWRSQWCTQSEFAHGMGLPANKAFARALQEAEARKQ